MALQDLLALIYPTTCLLCNSAGVTLCPTCEIRLESCRQSYLLHGFTLYSSLHYNEAAANLILAAKESNERAAARYLAELMAMRFGRAHRELSYARYLLIPIPSSKASDKRRGYQHMVLLARLVSKRITVDHGVECSVAPVLVPARKVADQSGLNAAARLANMRGAFELKAGVDLRGAGIILIDDLVTTGSTMGEALRALKMGRYEPDALLSACVAGRFLANKIGR
jgi:ComF family protein